MLLERNELLDLFVCPRTGAALADTDDGKQLVCQPEPPLASDPPLAYEVVDRYPVLVDFSQSVLRRESLLSTGAASVVPRRQGSLRGLCKRIVSPPKRTTARNVERMAADLNASGMIRPRVLVVGGGTIGQGMAPLYASPSIEVVAFDIYASPCVQFVADAHQIPIRDASMDGVVVQAVLEHVLDPQRVVAEIHRVLKPGGIVYAETPFLQQVHEGPYDFTRFTESGHRYLFKHFDLIASGASAGPGTQMLWTIDYFVRSLFRSRWMGKLAKAACFWVQYADLLIPEAYHVDSAAGVYFMGRKSTTTATPAEIVAHYRGAQTRAA